MSTIVFDSDGLIKIVRSGIFEQIKLKCVISEEAKQNNNERNQCILHAIIKFGKAIISEANVCNVSYS